MRHLDLMFRRPSFLGAIACALAVTGVAAARVAHSASSTTLGTEKVKLGKVIDTSAGRAVYLFTKDSGVKSNCTGSCVRYWPPLIASGSVTVAKGSGLDPKLLGTTRRSDGKAQVTYNHHPLYLDTGDHRRGDINGEGAKAFAGRWYLVTPSGKAAKPSCPPGYVLTPTGCLPGSY
jgi:predicted lipoprotein with Yx(FWY)xxD motif